MRIDCNGSSNHYAQLNAMRSFRGSNTGTPPTLAANANGSPAATASATEATQATPISAPLTAPAASPLQALLNAWGSADAEFDLNGDGTVDGLDLGMFLGKTSSTQAASADPNAPFPAPGSNPAPAPEGEPAPATDTAPAPGSNDPALRALLRAWGTSDSQYDLDANGTVDGLDLAHFLASVSAMTVEPEAQAPAAASLASNNDVAQGQSPVAVIDNSAATVAVPEPPEPEISTAAPLITNDQPPLAPANTPVSTPVITPAATQANASVATAALLGNVSTTAPATIADDDAVLTPVANDNPATRSSPIAEAPSATLAANDVATQTRLDNQIAPVPAVTINQAAQVYGLAHQLLSKVSLDNEAIPAAKRDNGPSRASEARRAERGRDNLAAALTREASRTSENESPLLALRQAVDGLQMGVNERGLLLRRFLAEFPQGLGINQVG